MTCRLYKGVAIVVAAKQNSLEKPVASTTAPASRFSPKEKKTLRTPCFPLFSWSAEIYFRKRDSGMREKEARPSPWTRKERRVMKQNSKGKEIEQDGNNGKENREQSSTAKQAHNQSATSKR